MRHAGASAMRKHKTGAQSGRTRQQRGNRRRLADIDLERLRSSDIHRELTHRFFLLSHRRASTQLAFPGWRRDDPSPGPPPGSRAASRQSDFVRPGLNNPNGLSVVPASVGAGRSRLLRIPKALARWYSSITGWTESGRRE
jgi:hypothetical protein